jgi:hypothetical protein
MTKPEFVIRHSSFVIPFVIRHSSFVIHFVLQFLLTVNPLTACSISLA